MHNYVILNIHVDMWISIMTFLLVTMYFWIIKITLCISGIVFSFWISEMKIMTGNNWIEDICNGSFS